MGNHSEMQQAYEKMVDYRVNTCRALLNQPITAIREQLQAEHDYRTEAFSTIPSGVQEEFYGGTVNVTFGAIYGVVKAEINFAGGYKGNFEGTIWGFGLGAGTGAGGGPWADGYLRPGNGEQMGFEIVSAGAGAGGTQIFWISNGVIVGSFVSVNLSLGVFAGGGNGRWTVTPPPA